MAYLDTLSDEDRRQLEETSGGAPASAGGGSGPAPSTPSAPASGFQNLSNYFTANADAAKTQGTETAAGLEKDAVGAIFGDDPGKAMDVYGQIDAAGRPDTLATVGQGERSGGESRLDAYLSTRGAEPGRFENLRNTFGDHLLAVEPTMGSPDLMPRYEYGSPTDQLDAAMNQDSHQGLIDEAKQKTRDAVDAERARVASPYQEYTQRRDANRAPFQDLYTYYFPENRWGPAGPPTVRPHDGEGSP